MKRNNIQEKLGLGNSATIIVKEMLLLKKKSKTAKKYLMIFLKRLTQNKINRVLEVGCNQGRNLLAMQNVFGCECFGRI